MASHAELLDSLTAARHRTTDYVASQLQDAINELEADRIADMETVEDHVDNALGVARSSEYPPHTIAVIEEAKQLLDESYSRQVPAAALPSDIRTETYQYE